MPELPDLDEIHDGDSESVDSLRKMAMPLQPFDTLLNMAYALGRSRGRLESLDRIGEVLKGPENG